MVKLLERYSEDLAIETQNMGLLSWFLFSLLLSSSPKLRKLTPY